MTSPYPLLSIVGIVLAVLTIAASLIYVERRLLALWQDLRLAFRTFVVADFPGFPVFFCSFAWVQFPKECQ